MHTYAKLNTAKIQQKYSNNTATIQLQHCKLSKKNKTKYICNARDSTIITIQSKIVKINVTKNALQLTN